jgi:hypothetical protein
MEFMHKTPDTMEVDFSISNYKVAQHKEYF